jgi:hypothetical protein
LKCVVTEMYLCHTVDIVHLRHIKLNFQTNWCTIKTTFYCSFIKIVKTVKIIPLHVFRSSDHRQGVFLECYCRFSHIILTKTFNKDYNLYYISFSVLQNYVTEATVALKKTLTMIRGSKHV